MDVGRRVALRWDAHVGEARGSDVRCTWARARGSGNESIVRLVFGISEGLETKEKAKPAMPMEVMRRGSLPSCTSQDRRTRAFFDAISEGDTTRVERILTATREGLEPFNVDCSVGAATTTHTA
jgi:hypothetical protein